VYTHSVHELSVNSIDFVHPDFGLALGAASSDGKVSILTHSQQTGSWSSTSFVAHQIGVNAISFAPPSVGGWLSTESSADSTAPPRLRFATGGCDNLVKIWVQAAGGGGYECEAELSFHKDWVRDVAWSPSVGLPGTALASGSQDGVVAVWSEDATKRGAAAFLPTQLPKFPGTVWRTTWSPTGNVLAVSSGDNKVSLWKETADGSFECVSTVDPAAQQAGAGAVQQQQQQGGAQPVAQTAA
jgi:protein transport protein SEC13